MFKEKTGEERMMMGFSMFETSRTLVRVGILSRRPGISEKDLKIEMFKIFYGRDFDPATREKIINSL
jgi:hypothetical protein